MYVNPIHEVAMETESAPRRLGMSNHHNSSEVQLKWTGNQILPKLNRWT